MKITQRPKTIDIDGIPVRIGRTTEGVVEIWADDDIQLAAGLGFAHAQDRLVQMMLSRLAGQGRMSECLRTEEETQRVDTFMRTMGFAHYAQQEVARCTPQALQYAQAYARGVQHYVDQHWRPWELKLVGYQPEPWTVADTLVCLRLMFFLGLAQCQMEIEKFIIQAIHAGVSTVKLKQLFAPHLDALDGELVDRIRQVTICRHVVPANIKFAAGMSALRGSNNWAVAGSRSATGFPLECHDPHVACNYLPQVWYEFVLHAGDEYRIGMNMPGVPGFIMGRNRDVSLGFTYGFMDTIDFFLEDCHGGKYRRGDRWLEFETRTEIIRRKGHEPLTLTVRENELGVLESDVLNPRLPDGSYLCCAWTAQRQGTAESLDALYRLQRVRSVSEAQEATRGMALSANWGMADRHGNIGYQQSGIQPLRGHSGLHPVPAWMPEGAWKGFLPQEQLVCRLNPTEGIIATANNDLNQPGVPPAINLCMGPDRVERIRELLADRTQLTVDDMKQMQRDLYSNQAARLMKVLRPLVPTDSDSGRLLLDWDLCYDRDSIGASLFEKVYEAILEEVFGNRLFGVEIWKELTTQSGLVAAYFHTFDKCLLGLGGPWDEAEWFGVEGRDSLLRRVVAETLADSPADRVPKWGDERRFTLSNLLLGGKLPRALGIDRGPITFAGGRATLLMGSRVVNDGRLAVIAPSYRAITDLGADCVETALAGGPSDRPWSRLYTIGVQPWLNHQYKSLAARQPDPAKD